MPQGKPLGAVAAQPEIFHGFVLGIHGIGGKAKESPPIHAHEHLGALRVGTLGNHESTAAAAAPYFDVNNSSNVARNLCRPQSQKPEYGWQAFVQSAVNFLYEIPLSKVAESRG